jgi:hypothetical protein
VVFWRPIHPDEFAEDIAGLELESSPPEVAKLAQLVTSKDLWGHPFRVLGFPAGKSNGAWASGELRAGLANGRVQLEDVKQQGYALEPGFSGAPIWDEKLVGIAGMAVAAEINRPDAKAAFMIPTKVLHKAWSELSSILYPEEPWTEQEFLIFDEALYSSCHKEVKKPGALLRIKAPLCWGKTYLMKEILDYATKESYRAVRVDLKQAETEVFDSLEGFLRWFCSYISWKLQVEDRVDEYWQGILHPKMKCTKYFQTYLLQENQSPLVLGLDDVDLLFPHLSIAHEFFSLLRSWHDAKNEPIWQKLRLLLAYSKEDYIPLHNNQSPFNVGVPIPLPELTEMQVQNLAQCYQLYWSEIQVKTFMAMVGGHPYLVRLGLEKIGRGEQTLEQFLEIAHTEEGLYCDHLLNHLSKLEENPELQAAIRRVVAAHSPVSLDTGKASKLVNMGLVKRKANGVVPVCELYRLYFGERLRVN